MVPVPRLSCLLLLSALARPANLLTGEALFHDQ